MARPRKSAGLKLLEGNRRKVKKADFEREIASEPQPQRGYPECPAHLQGNAREGWHRLTEALASVGMDYKVDSMAIQAAATLYGRATDADALLAEKGLTYEEPVLDKLGGIAGYVIKTRPEEILSRRSWALFRQYAQELGATVISRARLTVPVEKKSESAEDGAIFGT